VLGVLKEIFRSNPVAADCRFPGEGNVTLKYLIGAAADFEVGAVAVEGLISLRCSLLRWKWPLAGKAPALALIWSHFFLTSWDGSCTARSGSAIAIIEPFGSRSQRPWSSDGRKGAVIPYPAPACDKITLDEVEKKIML
jgi:hypothetical protein